MFLTVKPGASPGDLIRTWAQQRRVLVLEDDRAAGGFPAYRHKPPFTRAFSLTSSSRASSEASEDACPPGPTVYEEFALA
jgi:hypothetical protein